MQFNQTSLADVWLIELEPVRDRRGFFCRSFSTQTFTEKGLETSYPQHSLSRSRRRGTLRGMHYQREPHAEVKVIRCARGSIFDVVIDLRQHSLTYHQWECFELTEDNHRQLYVPKGFAHGFQTLS